jgi:glutamate-1-semialdehyde 2,1-aminomutase
MALRAVTIGYADDRVNGAAIAEIEKGVNLTRASMTELEAAERICEIVPCADMVKFGKNGSNVTTAAAKIARAYTGRRYICVPRQHPFFSFDDWFIGTTVMKRGVVEDQSSTTLLFDYNDPSSLQALFDSHGADIAAVMLEPATHLVPHLADGTPAPADTFTAERRPAPNFLHCVREMAHRAGALFILDEMITGFRWNFRGGAHYFDVAPDLATFGKGMANGFSLAAVVGRREIMEVGSIDKPGAERTFLLSTTHGGEMPALGAFLAAARINEQDDVSGHLWSFGNQFRNLWHEIAARHGLAEQITLEGPAVALNYVTRDHEGQPSLGFRTLFAQEMLRAGVMMPWIAFSQAHGQQELDRTGEALERAMAVYADALDSGLARFLEGPAIKPVFRARN